MVGNALDFELELLLSLLSQLFYCIQSPKGRSQLLYLCLPDLGSLTLWGKLNATEKLLLQFEHGSPGPSSSNRANQAAGSQRYSEENRLKIGSLKGKDRRWETCTFWEIYNWDWFIHAIIYVLILHHSPLRFSHSVKSPIMATPHTSPLLLNEEGS